MVLTTKLEAMNVTAGDVGAATGDGGDKNTIQEKREKQREEDKLHEDRETKAEESKPIDATQGEGGGKEKETQSSISTHQSYTPFPRHTTRAEHDAAVSIQRIYRGHRARRHLRGLRLTADERWTDALSEAMYRTRNKPMSRDERERQLLHATVNVTPPTPVVKPNEEGEERRMQEEVIGLRTPPGQGAAERGRSLSPASRDRWTRASYIAKLIQQDDPESESDSSTTSSSSSSSCNSSTSSSKRRRRRRTVDHLEAGYSGDGSSRAETTATEGRIRSWRKRRSSAVGASGGTGGEKVDPKEEKRRRKERLKAKRMERIENAKAMDILYFLELVDLKHRYGANLKVYHDYWQAQDTHENFFYW
ncbi:hypothetical protein BDZ91DRAFT_61641 [Kalaharituber pfeilii]|nr:hypothetical protein BDZ91DRAFT_61641 [Kalaharituber pfeilii]